MKNNNTEIKRYNAIINDAWRLVAQLTKTREKAAKLAERCNAYSEKYNTSELDNLAQVFADLSSFDLEDNIPEEKESI